MESLPLTLSFADIGKHLRLSKSAVYRWKDEGMPWKLFRVRGRYRVKREEFLRWLDGQSGTNCTKEAA